MSDTRRYVASTLIRLAWKNDYSILFGETYSKDSATRVHEARELVAEMIRSHVAGVLYQPFEAVNTVDSGERCCFHSVGVEPNLS